MKKNNNLLNLNKLQYKLISPHILQPSLKSSVCSSAFLFDSKLDKINKISNSSASIDSDPYATSQVYCIPQPTENYLSIPIPQPTAYELDKYKHRNPNILRERSDECNGVIVIEL